MGMQYFEFQRIEKIKRLLDVIAYASLALDVGIAIVTLLSLNVSYGNLGSVQYFLDIALSVEVVVVLVLFAAMLFLYRYQKIILDLARMSRSLSGKTGKGLRRSQRRL
jgi:membrane protein implicated in regulation of membrane protease activity